MTGAISGSRSTSDFDWRRFGPGVLAPAVLFATANGVVAPVLPVVAVHLGASLAEAGLVAGLLVLGFLVGNVPTGFVVDRLGERRAMLAAAVVSIAGLTIAWSASTVAVLALGAVLSGLAEPTYHIARQALVTVVVPPTHRARIISTLAGGLRLGALVGPLIAGAAIAAAGSVRAVYPAAIAVVLLGVIAVRWLPDPEQYAGAQPPAAARAPRATFAETLWANRRVLLRLGPVAMVVMAMRHGRNAVIPLWGVSIGAGASQIALVVAVAALLDFALFYPTGSIMDRFGRWWIAVPTLALFAVGWFYLALTGFIGADGTEWWIAGALLAGAANGVSSGVVAVIGSDVADRSRPATFLAVWQLTANLGGTATPFAIAGVTALSSLTVAVLGLGVLGAAGAVAASVLLPRYLPTAFSTRPEQVAVPEPAEVSQ